MLKSIRAKSTGAGAGWHRNAQGKVIVRLFGYATDDTLKAARNRHVYIEMTLDEARSTADIIKSIGMEDRDEQS